MALIAIPPQLTTLQNLPPKPLTAPPSKYSLTSPPPPNASSTSTVTFSYYPTKSANSVSVSNTTCTSRRSSLVVRASTSPFSPNIADTLGDVNIFTAAGDPVFFKDLWDQNQGIAVVALLRHFGCPCSWELASALKEAKPKFDAAGVKLVAIGVGTPDKARILADRLPFPMDCLYADPERKAYDILGLYYGFGRTFFTPAIAKVFSRFGALQKAVKNYTIKAIADDKSSVLQQGGMFVFKGKQLLYARKDEGTGDHAPLDDIFDVCCKVPVA
ncbi:thioredoxin-like protein AAED1, chloroplastic isoform X5 [Quercus robur]|uniref:thioredoxin-like protein AAED1, chloroplastic isoform X5 n=1 Tax=Quercus robur TaxID=38942 RepID=UPI0021620FFB|nr:thioredoxin-like protein AAED1, chloroplastic isoform X5 [Quercus robur]